MFVAVVALEAIGARRKYQGKPVNLYWLFFPWKTRTKRWKYLIRSIVTTHDGLTITIELQGSISPTFYEQLLCTQIPKAQKKTVKLSSFIALLGSARVRAARRTLVKLTPCLPSHSKNLCLHFLALFFAFLHDLFLGSDLAARDNKFKLSSTLAISSNKFRQWQWVRRISNCIIMVVGRNAIISVIDCGPYKRFNFNVLILTFLEASNIFWSKNWLSQRTKTTCKYKKVTIVGTLWQGWDYRVICG